MKIENVLLVTNDQYLPMLLDLLSQAKKSIDIIAYSFAIGSAAGKLSETGAPFKIAEKLIQIKKQLGTKISIRLYIEGYRETADRNLITAKYLERAGIHVRLGTTHAKGFCIDGRYVLFGSTNLTNQSIVKNNETNLLFDDKSAAKGFMKYFEHFWSGGIHGEVDLPPPMIADGKFAKELIDIIDAAENSLEFSIYFFHHTEIETALLRAHKRGVKIRGFIHHHDSFALSYVKRTRGTANRLLAGKIKDLHFGPGHLFTHSKYIIRDHEEILLGTGNWLHEDIKIHPQLYVRFTNPQLAKDLGKILARQIRNSQSVAELNPTIRS